MKTCAFTTVHLSPLPFTAAPRLSDWPSLWRVQQCGGVHSEGRVSSHWSPFYTSALRRRHETCAVIQPSKFNVEGTRSSAIHRQATRGLWLRVWMVSGGLMMDLLVFFLPVRRRIMATALKKNNVIPKVEVHARMFAQVVYPTTESVEVKNEWLYCTSLPTEEPRWLNSLWLFSKVNGPKWWFSSVLLRLKPKS